MNDKKQSTIKIDLNETVICEITEYMKWAEIKYKDYFIEEACKHVLNNDPQWQKYKVLNFDDDMQRKDESSTDIQNKMLADDDGMKLSSHNRNLGEDLKKK